MIYAKPSTSLLVVFRAYLASDHVTPATGKTIAITISKNGGAFGNPNAGATNATEISSGFYKVTLDATDTGTAGPLAVRGAVATVDDVGAIFYVGQAPADVTHFGGSAGIFASGRPEVNTTHLAGTAYGSADFSATMKASINTEADTAASDYGALKPTVAGRTANVDASGRVLADVDTIKTNPVVNAGTVTFPTGATLASTTNITAGTVTTATNVTTVNGLAANVITAASLAADAGAEIADAVWDEATAGHATAGSTGVALTDILTDTGTTLDGRIPAALVGGRMDVNVGAISTDATAADNLEAMLDGTGGVTLTTALTGAITGNITGNLSGSVGSVTGNVGGSVGSVTGAVGSVTGAVGSVTGAVGSVTGNVGGNVTGSVGSLAAQAKADVNTEVLDVLNVDTFAEPGQEAPAATNTLVKKIGYLFKLLRNKITQTSTTLSVFDDAGTTVDQKATISDDGTTYTRGEIGTGP